MSALHRGLYRLSGGILGRRLVDNDMLLLTTTGRKTKRPHTVPLLYLQEGDRLVVIASYGGRPRHPDWFENLLAHPVAEVQIKNRKIPVMSRVANPAERAEWWPRAVAAYSDYADYQTRTDRQIPVVFLER